MTRSSPFRRDRRSRTAPTPRPIEIADLAAQGRRPPGVLALAAPALVVLAAEPLYLLVDTAVVGNLGTVALGGLAVGGGLLAWPPRC